VRLTLNRTIVPIQLPIGEERDFSGVVDLVSMKAYTNASDGSGKSAKARCRRHGRRREQRARRADREWLPRPTKR
jgi:translation elongation factor EF-G